MIRRDERDVSGGIDCRARFGLRLAVDAHLSGQNQRARPLPRRRETFIDNQLVQSHAQCLQP
jgi:hypothetical protein